MHTRSYKSRACKRLISAATESRRGADRSSCAIINVLEHNTNTQVFLSNKTEFLQILSCSFKCFVHLLRMRAITDTGRSLSTSFPADDARHSVRPFAGRSSCLCCLLIGSQYTVPQMLNVRGLCNHTSDT